ncbi:MAG: hypothetical protein K9G46_15535 [Flavobacteriales bacterium]|nr:hypothetical protein [Flavobacteriales bacterium]
MMLFIGNTIGINLEEVNDKIVLKVKLNSIKAQTSEPVNNKNRKEKEKQQKFILIDFEILNQPAVNYSLHVYKGKDKIFDQVFLSAVTVTANKTPKDGKAPKLKKSDEENYHQPGKYQIVWVCTDNGVFDEKDDKQKLAIKIQATGVAKQIAIAEKEILIKETVEQAETDNFIILEESEGGEIKVFGSQIIERQKKFVSKIPKEIFDKLSEEGKLILNLPIIMTKLNFLYGALCQIHWLEGSKSSLKFPYEFFMSEKRVENIDRKNLEEYFKELRYLSVDNLGYTPSNPDGVNLFLFNDSIPSIKIALEKFNENLAKRTEDGPIGGNEKLINEISEWNKLKKADGRLDTKLLKEVFMENYFQAFSMGSPSGNIDDLGVAIGMYRPVCYFKGLLEKNTITGKWILRIEEVKCRFFDEFSFNDNLIDFGTIEYSQPLGCWHTETDKPKMPHYTKIHKPDGLTVCLQNMDYQELKITLSKSLPNSCNDFFIYSNNKTIDDDYLQKDIVIL